MIAELTRLAGEADEGTTPEDIVLGQVAAGLTLRAIAKDISAAAGLYISPETLTLWINRTPELKTKLAAARKAGAPSMVEHAAELLEEVDTDRDAIAKAKAIAEQRNWMASKYDRQTFGNDAAQVNVQLSLGDMHLDALRQRVVPIVRAPAAVTDGTPDFEVVPD